VLRSSVKKPHRGRETGRVQRRGQYPAGFTLGDIVASEALSEGKKMQEGCQYCFMYGVCKPLSGMGLEQW
jgi:hypothetical protein